MLRRRQQQIRGVERGALTVWPLGRLEQFHRVSRWIVQQDLLSTGSGRDVVAEFDAGLAKSGDLAGQIVGLQDDAVPTARLRLATIGHGLGAAAGALRRAENELQLVA